MARDTAAEVGVAAQMQPYEQGLIIITEYVSNDQEPGI